MADARDRFDVIIDTIASPHDLGPYLRLVAMVGTLNHLGYLGPVTVETTDLLVGRKKLSSAGSGGSPATAAMLDFCGEHGITSDIELLPSSLPLRTRHVRPGLDGEGQEPQYVWGSIYLAARRIAAIRTRNKVAKVQNPAAERGRNDFVKAPVTDQGPQNVCGSGGGGAGCRSASRKSFGAGSKPAGQVSEGRRTRGSCEDMPVDGAMTPRPRSGHRSPARSATHRSVRALGAPTVWEILEGAGIPPPTARPPCPRPGAASGAPRERHSWPATPSSCPIPPALRVCPGFLRPGRDPEGRRVTPRENRARGSCCRA
ncbi:hypothetical protein QF027_009324 [Streptomyces canus]|nr:hypothetical protein [Streptomyces canus]